VVGIFASYAEGPRFKSHLRLAILMEVFQDFPVSPAGCWESTLNCYMAISIHILYNLLFIGHFILYNCSYWQGHAIAQVVSDQLLSAESRFSAQCGPCRFVMEKVTLTQGFVTGCQFSPVGIVSPLLHIHSYIMWGMDKGPIRVPVPQRQRLMPLQQ
jgi:hypothetical protein